MTWAGGMVVQTDVRYCAALALGLLLLFSVSSPVFSQERDPGDMTDAEILAELELILVEQERDNERLSTELIEARRELGDLRQTSTAELEALTTDLQAHNSSLSEAERTIAAVEASLQSYAAGILRSHVMTGTVAGLSAGAVATLIMMHEDTGARQAALTIGGSAVVGALVGWIRGRGRSELVGEI